MKTRTLITAVLVALLGTATVPALAEEDKATGLERARQASTKAIEHANARMVEARGGELPRGLREDRVTGRARAAQAIAAAMERGNGNGNAFGRGRSAQVLDILLEGGSPRVLESDASHGAAVRDMVKAHNELRKQASS